MNGSKQILRNGFEVLSKRNVGLKTGSCFIPYQQRRNYSRPIISGEIGRPGSLSKQRVIPTSEAYDRIVEENRLNDAFNMLPLPDEKPQDEDAEEDWHFTKMPFENIETNHEHDLDWLKDYPFQYMIKVGHHCKVVKGGRHFSGSVFLLLGNGRGEAGWGYGKDVLVSKALDKALRSAHKNLYTIDRYDNCSISHEIRVRFIKSEVVLSPLRRGAGIRAGPFLTAIGQTMGVTDFHGRMHGNRNPINMMKAVFLAFSQSMSDHRKAKMMGKVRWSPTKVYRPDGKHQSHSVLTPLPKQQFHYPKTLHNVYPNKFTK